MTPRISLVLDCVDPDALAPFWVEALGYGVVGRAGSYVMLGPTDGDGPQLLLQRVPEAKHTKNRMHLDLHVADIDSEADRLIGLGADRVNASRREEHDSRWIVLTDPDGNEFCLCDASGCC